MSATLLATVEVSRHPPDTLPIQRDLETGRPLRNASRNQAYIAPNMVSNWASNQTLSGSGVRKARVPGKTRRSLTRLRPEYSEVVHRHRRHPFVSCNVLQQAL